MKRILYETDWLASKSVFREVQTQRVDYDIKDVIVPADAGERFVVQP
jgi:hypothetical protein